MQTHDIIELSGVLNSAFPTPADVAPPQVAAEVGRGSWKRGHTPEKHVAVFIKKLRFPSKAMTAKDAEWEAWRQRNLTYRFKETPCLVVPRVDGGNIFQFVNGHPDFTESRKLALLYDAARAIAYLHSQSPPIVHGRIHPTEILVNNQGRAILFDFGIHHAVANLERSPPQSTSETVLPDGGYCAPEILKGQVLTPAADAYAFAGVILVVMTGKHPHNDHPSPIMAWMEGKPEPRDHPALPSSHPLWELMNEMWAVPPTERPTMLRVTESLEYLLKTQGYSVTFNSEPVEHEDSTDADEQSDPYEEPNPHLKEFVDEAIRLIDLSRIGTSFSFSELLQRLDHELAPELGGELVELDPNVAQGAYAFVSRYQWKTLRPDGTVSETCVAVKALRIGRMSALEKEARISIVSG
ncbi:hypothetical protein FRC05_008327 [Tulasnella sp. 425]|nr:hypothetical protein FRC05_008327 [Tulasnella sp. 425]